MVKKSGFTLIEIIVAVAVLLILALISVADFVFLQKKNVLDNSVQEFIGTVKNAQNKTLASESGAQYGVYLNVFVSPNQYTLFKGTSYVLREIAFDQIKFLPDLIEFYDISLNGGSEVVFDRITGTAESQGSVSLRVKTDVSQNKTVYISNFGVISLAPLPGNLDENRVKDARHVVLDYSRVIDVNNENIQLTFDGSVIQQIQLNQMQNQIDWEGTVNVGGSNQKVRIRTYRLNNPDTQFSIERDRRYNDKSLAITISGDGSGSLAQYLANGLTASYSSIYVSNFSLK